MRLRFLGTGTSAGVPAIGIEPRSDDPRDVRLRTSATVEFVDPSGEERVILIDAGPDLRQQALSAGMTRLDAILITHHHVDHCWGLDEVRRFNVMMDRAIDLYGSRVTLDRLRVVYQHIFEAHRNIQRSFVATLIGHEARAGEAFELFGVRVTPLHLLHGRMPVLGFRFDRVDGARVGAFPMAYCTDVSSIPTETWGALGGLKTLVLDGLRQRKHPTHMTIDESAATAERIGAEMTYMVHMSHEVVHAEAEAGLPENIRLAYDGLVVGG